MIVQTEQIGPDLQLSGHENYQTYCGLDTMVTLEVWEELQRLYSSKIPPIYSFERALQGPYLEIMQRGFKVDAACRRTASHAIRHRLLALEATLDELARGVWDRGLNPRSPAQLKDFFYRAMRLPEVILNFKGERKVSTNREALEKLDIYLYARPFTGIILRIRDLTKQLNTLEMEIDSDGRFRTSYNIAGTETGRPSSSENAFGTGGNAQNIAPGLRYVFVADPGWKVCNIDLEQVEARDVGFFCGCLFDDWTFLDACESGDLHTNNAKLIWPELHWTGNAKADRAIADRLFYRDFTYRDMAKRGSHLSNYSGTAYTAARSLKVPIGIMEDFQARYCRGSTSISPAYPCIPRWWQWTAQQLQTIGSITTPFGRRRHFFGRPDDNTTLREAIAFLPQSTTADRMNLGLWRVWHGIPDIQLLAQTYDSITFQYRDEPGGDGIIKKALDLIRVELVAPNGRKYVVPGEAQVGWNWGKRVLQADVDRARERGTPEYKLPRLNLDGLTKWSPSSPDTRTRTSFLEQSIE